MKNDESNSEEDHDEDKKESIKGTMRDSEEEQKSYSTVSSTRWMSSSKLIRIMMNQISIVDDNLIE